jgi:hypothetical protein
MSEDNAPIDGEIIDPSHVELLRKNEDLKNKVKSLEVTLMKMSDCPNKWKLDVNDRYQKAVGVVTTLSTAALVLPIFFLKDIAKIDGVHSIAGALSAWWVAGWFLLATSVLSGIIYYFCSAKWVKLAWGMKADIFGIKVSDQAVETMLDVSYFLMMTGFITGLFCTLAFIVTFSLKAPAIESAQTKCRGGFDAVGEIGPFVPGESILSKNVDLGKLLTGVDQKNTEHCGKPIAIFLVGSTDRRVLEGKQKSAYGGNSGLARARADHIGNVIKGRLSFDERVKFVSLISGPAWHGLENDPGNEEQMARDRSVSVYGIWKTKSASGD